MRTLLFDADSFLYHRALGNTKQYDWGDGIQSYDADFPTARDELRAGFRDLQDQLNADEIVVALTDYDNQNFRKAIYEGYKQTRKEKPQMLYDLRAFVRENYNCYIRPSLEADDIVGILSTHPTLIKGEKIVVSIDKDLRSVPGLLANPTVVDKKGIPIVERIEEANADRFFMTQVLTGDKTDEYPGCPGIGPKKAAKALYPATDLRSMWEAVVEVYKDKGHTAKDALAQARCARILRATDYNFKTKKVKLWTPPKLSA